MRCATVLAQGSRLGPDTALVFALTGLILALPASLLTFVSAGKLGAERMSSLFTGVASLWGGGMRLLAVLVLLCGGLIPFALLAALAVVNAPERLGWRKAGLDRSSGLRASSGTGRSPRCRCSRSWSPS